MPRPQSFTIHIETANKPKNDYEKEHLYRELASAAESGWNFSTRWMKWNLTYLSWPLLLEKAAMLYTLLEIQNQERRPWTLFFGMKKKDNGLINGSTIVLTKWDAANQNHSSFVSNFIPLWVQLFNSDETIVNKVAQSLESSGLVRAASIATSLTNSSEQWDFPNGWAPIQHMIVEGLVRSGSKEARSLAND
ncbi:hypothetical protein R6Q57_023582 [Mikania cordata]